MTQTDKDSVIAAIVATVSLGLILTISIMAGTISDKNDEIRKLRNEKSVVQTEVNELRFKLECKDAGGSVVEGKCFVKEK